MATLGAKEFGNSDRYIHTKGCIDCLIHHKDIIKFLGVYAFMHYTVRYKILVGENLANFADPSSIHQNILSQILAKHTDSIQYVCQYIIHQIHTASKILYRQNFVSYSRLSIKHLRRQFCT